MQYPSHISLSIALLCCIITGSGCKLASLQQPTYNWQALPDLPCAGYTPSPGVSAPFAGIHNDMLIVAGGCNFPDIPVADGGAKKYYNTIYVLDLKKETGAQWTGPYHLPYTVAYGASVSSPKGLICIGGNNDTTTLASVILLKWDAAQQQITTDSLPSLPCPVDNTGATLIGNDLYVAGGNCDGVPHSYVFRLSLNKLQNGWKKLYSVPGMARVQPVVVSQKAKEGTRLYVSSGFHPSVYDSKPFIDTEMMVFNPDANTWETAAGIPPFQDNSPRTFTGGCAVPFGNDSLLFIGGVNYTRFLSTLERDKEIKAAVRNGNNLAADSLKTESRNYLLHPAEWYQFNTSLLIYNTKTGKWTHAGDFPQLARAGAQAVVYNNKLIIINGELKPGIRTPQVNMLSIEQ